MSYKFWQIVLSHMNHAENSALGSGMHSNYLQSKCTVLVAASIFFWSTSSTFLITKIGHCHLNHSSVMQKLINEIFRSMTLTAANILFWYDITLGPICQPFLYFCRCFENRHRLLQSHGYDFRRAKQFHVFSFC